jgi:hypothetical protein
MQQSFTGFEYVCIDIANQYGLDKELFDDRIQWTLVNINDLELIGECKGNWKAKPLYLKGIQTLRNIQCGYPTGSMVGLDATCSGIQIMSALTGCFKGGLITNLVDPKKRYDAYQEALEAMRVYVPGLDDKERQKLKDAVMTVFYGSIAEPEKLFGEGTPELEAFYKAMIDIAPGASQLLEVLRSTWKPYVMAHGWVLPDNHHSFIKVMVKCEDKIEVDELQTQFQYRYKVNAGKRKGVSNIANVVHSIDSYIARSLIRRCSYDPTEIDNKRVYLVHEIHERSNSNRIDKSLMSENLKTMLSRWTDSKMVDLTILQYLDAFTVKFLSDQHLYALYNLLQNMVENPPFQVLTIHDDFKCSPNNMNVLRFHYREILAELAESTILDDILSQMFGSKVQFPKLSTNLGDAIRESNYSIC